MNTGSPQRIAITPSEPAGIGPDILLQAAQQAHDAELVVFADPDLLQQRAKALKLDIDLHVFDSAHYRPQQAKQLSIVPINLKQPAIAGQLNVDNSHYVIECLETATRYCLEHTCQALVTGPVHKGIINEAGIAFTGHTELLATLCQTPDVVMLLAGEHGNVAMQTTHMPLTEVSKHITTEKLITKITLLNQNLQHLFQLTSPRIRVCGLNPHAGEDGHLGREEIDIIQPAIQHCQQHHIDVDGPYPADTIFTPPHLENADVILAMYHDQGLAPFKALNFHNAVNITLGLPILRCSVDHGTALRLAATGLANPSSFNRALAIATEVTASH